MQGEVQGPVAYKSLVRWREKGQLDEDELRCQHEATRCWVPLWFVVAAGEKVALEGEWLQGASTAGGSGGACLPAGRRPSRLHAPALPSLCWPPGHAPCPCPCHATALRVCS